MNEVLMNAAVNGEEPKMKHMKPWKRVVFTIIPIVLAALIAGGVYVFFYGMPLSGAPKPGDVESVTVKHGEMEGEKTDYTDQENIELACKLLSSANYALFTEASEADGPDVLITFNLKDGKRLVAAANKETVWWRGKSYPLKEKDLFFNLVHGVFHLGDCPEPVTAADAGGETVAG